MATTKEMFLSDKVLRDWWASIANDPRFDRVLLHAQGYALETMPSVEQRAGLMGMKDVLLTLAEPDAEPVQYASPGLRHDFDKTDRTLKQPETTTKTKSKKK